MKPVSTLGGAINLAPHLSSLPTAVAAAARAVVSWATALANQCSAIRALHYWRDMHNILDSLF
jgi:hypothetical protein